MTQKILIINDNLPNQVNGVVTTYKNIEPYAIRDGYTIDYIHPGRYRYINCPKYNEVKLAWATPSMVGKTIEEISPDYIHIATEGPLGLSARRYLTIRGYRYNTAYHTKFPEGIKAILGIPETITWPLIRWFHQNSNKVLTTTGSMVQTLKDNSFKGNIVSWTRGVDRNIFTPVFQKQEKTTLLYVGRLSKEKNIEAFLDLQIKANKIVVGDGPYKFYLQSKYPQVKFVGYKEGNNLAKYYQNADVLVFPSRWDTFGIVQIESMACGTPVAAYPVQGPLDVIDQNITGYMHEDLHLAVLGALKLEREKVYEGSMRWSWESAWCIFRDNLISKL